MTFTIRYAGSPLITWDDGTLTGDSRAVEVVRDRAAAGGTVGSTVINLDVPAGLTDAYPAFCTIQAALARTIWGGATTVDGDIGAPDLAFDPDAVY